MIRPKRETKIAKNPGPNPPFLANSITLLDPIRPARSTTYPLFTGDALGRIDRQPPFPPFPLTAANRIFC
jgi:hypothetical protein